MLQRCGGSTSGGGAGVLRQLLDAPDALAQVAAVALELCRFDAAGDDLGRAPGAKEDCEAACYDSLMSYTNQRDHELLERKLIRETLLALAGSRVIASPVALSRPAHLARLKALCDSDLERQWLDFLETNGLRLPDEAQKLIEACGTRPDFFYSGAQAAVYIDGPVHDQPDVAAEDLAMTDRLAWDAGLTVVRFRYDADWRAVCTEHTAVFGKIEAKASVASW